MANRKLDISSVDAQDSLKRRLAQHQPDAIPRAYAPLVDFLVKNVPLHPSADSLYPFCFEKMCSLVDEIGPKEVWTAIQLIIKNNVLQDSSILGGAFRDACMRFDGNAFGKLYTAHLRIMPIVVRGSHPRGFPIEIDRITAVRVQSVLQQFLLKQPYGDQCLALPISFAYTLDEIAKEGPPQFHEIAKQAMSGCSGHSIQESPKYVLTSPNFDEEKRTDSEMYNIRQPTIGVKGLNDRNMRLAANETPISKLPEGDWITTRFIPVVLLVPYGEEPLTINGFGPHAFKIGQILSFASTKQILDSDAENVSVIPMGMYAMQEGTVIGKMKVGHERVVSDIAKVSSMMIPEKTFVNLDYNPSDRLLSVVITDGEVETSHEVSLPVGMLAQQFVESLSVGIRGLGLKTEVDMGDSMIKFSHFESSLLH